ncbi:hypothetical protein M413DRAFT_73692 [Hebeloma cylindrosporum]|uniref:Haloacid dehalogenase-like hydrolase domain-containing protein 3 n=1 Tax=Hebeloma cylindrosporum TaxID=76867 RepID=A0A0C3C7J9_HEBCY|nr:hypothetical protein M413DRAFT_73692 [Hebeloma cylindrosporum h7]
MLQNIKLVTFDALHTLITPRAPIYVQYSQVFTPYLGVLPPESIKRSFKEALKAVQKEHPSYDKGVENWWRDVIRRTALGAGGNEREIDAHLSEIAKKLIKRFSSREGYRAFDDAIPTLHHLHNQLGVRTAVVSNGDSRIRAVLKDLDFPDTLWPVVLSDEEGIEKPSNEIFLKVLELVNNSYEHGRILPSECGHIGDELTCDYHGGVNAGFNTLLLRRPGPEGEHEHKDENESLEGVKVIHGLEEVIPWVQERNELA